MDKNVRNILVLLVAGLIVVSGVIYVTASLNQDRRNFESKDFVSPVDSSQEEIVSITINNLDFLGRVCDGYLMKDKADIEVVLNGFLSSLENNTPARIIIDSINKRVNPPDSLCIYTFKVDDREYYVETVYSPSDTPRTYIYDSRSKGTELYRGPNEH